MQPLDDANPFEQASSLLSVVRDSCGVRTRADLVQWLQGPLQRLIPHRTVVVAWGDLRAGAASCDIVPCAGELGCGPLSARDMRSLVAGLFEEWLAGDQVPLLLDAASLRVGDKPVVAASARTSVALVHGLTDRCGQYDCLYLFVGPRELATQPLAEMLRLLLPSIDAGFRRTTAEPAAAETTRAAAAPADGKKLSDREREVMHWVQLGKTNGEIGAIMSLSTFTVKNHMRRIYRKLDVMNRAQAVSELAVLAA